jgi:hypothetical protein
MSCTNSPKTSSPSTSEEPVLRLAMAKAKARAEHSENFEYGLKTVTDRSTIAYYLAEFINRVSCFKGRDSSSLSLFLAQTHQKKFLPQ